MKLFEIKNIFTGKIIFSSNAKSISHCVVLAMREEINLSSADLSSADLRYADLRYADLSYANLSYADLSSADLSYADLCHADLSSANLRSANLRHADLRYADLRSANLRSANLRSANLSSADLDYSSGTPLHCGGLKIKKDRKQIIQDIYHTASNMKYYLLGNKDEKLEAIFKLAEGLQTEFHRISETGKL